MTAFSLSRLSRWPLKLQIRLLAVFAIVTVLACVALAVALVRQGESARVADAIAHLDRATGQMVAQYDYLRRSFEERGSASPLATGDDGLLQSLTAVALGGLPGVEGGFYRAEGGRVLGYAYPTYRGSGPKTDIPAAERPTIERVAVRAVEERRPADERVMAGPDLILFRALPLPSGAHAGAVWVMERLAGIRTPQRQLGNVRELENLIQRAVILAQGHLVTIDDLPALAGNTAERGGEARLTDLLAMPLEQALRELERTLIKRALIQAGGNKTEAARLLQMRRQQLYARLSELGLE